MLYSDRKPTRVAPHGVGVDIIVGFVALGLVLTMTSFVIMDKYLDFLREESRLRGVANSRFMAEYLEQDYPPELARHFQMVVTTTDVSFSGAQITNFFQGDE